MHRKQYTWLTVAALVLSGLGCSAKEGRDVSVEDLEQKAASGATVNTHGARIKLEQQMEREGKSAPAPETAPQ